MLMGGSIVYYCQIRHVFYASRLITCSWEYSTRGRACGFGRQAGYPVHGGVFLAIPACSHQMEPESSRSWRVFISSRASRLCFSQLLLLCLILSSGQAQVICGVHVSCNSPQGHDKWLWWDNHCNRNFRRTS